ncbi:hypothetical protein EJE24_22680 [Enterobacter huaxiensis]|uniref:FidL n=1 Tax=Enterobacter huaxiensis TaxID=2494702 RepID=A0A3R9NE53_9ENTR|nr:hypothetical protein [Enterobacter huaxiensis]RSK63155.1 hypothetical protein EJE24_22680 [Enterobacter huaxiensis]
MNKTRVVVFTIIFFLIVTVICSYLYMQSIKLNHISCNAFYVAKNPEARLVSENHMELKNGIGSWMMNGRVNVSDKDVYYFKLRSQFSVKRTGYVFYVTNKKVMLSPNDMSKNKVLQEFLAAILRVEDAQSFFTIKPINENYIIYSGEVPIMYCMSDNRWR